MADLAEDAGRRPAGRNAWSNEVEKAIAGAGYYGRDGEEQRLRHHQGDIQQRIERGQLLIGAPDTVVRQVERIHRELRPGILDLALAARLGEKSRKSIELFGSKVLPRLHALN
jgi:alkanesulfonate monooxygenase SsuD/methylene tetrahydromethanopterin reductase-like flavin-dependent oxidoreductase (luciferase family)